jgi:hypothetical protein
MICMPARTAKKHARRAVSGVAVTLLALSTSHADAQFAAAISPPRFELEVEPGKTQRSVLEITHGGQQPGAYRVYTADWSMAPDGNVSFDSELPRAGSCRPWIALERREVKVAPSAKMRYRFEVSVPADTAPQECRFALMVESAEQAVGSGSLQIPMNGRIGVIVYVRVGGVRSGLQVLNSAAVVAEGQAVPALTVVNNGGATGRLAGFVSATLPDGSVVDLAPNSIPILPGMQRRVELLPLPPADRPTAAPPILKWPLRIKGRLESGQRDTPPIEIDGALTAP